MKLLTAAFTVLVLGRRHPVRSKRQRRRTGHNARHLLHRRRRRPVDPGGHAGGVPETGIEDTWQLHKTHHSDAQNCSDAFIANIEEGPRDTGAWIKVSAEECGRFTVTNGRTGMTKSYK